MEIVITQWALNAYLDLKHKQVFSSEEYWQELRTDVLLLKDYPKPANFKNGKFWSVAQDGKGHFLPNGFKMKWHQVGAGRVQLRLPVAVVQQQTQAVLCAGYVKPNEKMEKRQLAIFKTHLHLVKQNNYIECGILK